MNPIREGAVVAVLLGSSLGSVVAQSSPGTKHYDRGSVRRGQWDTRRNRYSRTELSGWMQGRDHFGSSLERARRFGYDDGLSDGANDRRNGYSFRPDHYDNYKNADRGCPFVNKEKYRQNYRQGYEEGYRRGYYAR